MTDAELAAQLIRAGFLPSLVEDALAAADTAEQALPTAADALGAEMTDADIEQAKVFWWYSPDVPQPFKRLLTARPREFPR